MIFYILDSDEKLVETIQSPNEEGEGGITAIDGIVEEKISTYELLELTVPADSKGLENIKEEMTLIFEDISGWREFTIYEIEDEDGDNFNTFIRAELGSSELIDEVIEDNHSGVSNNPETVLNKLLEGTRYSAGHVDSSVYSQAFNVNTEFMNVLEAINEFADNYNAEIRFSYVVDGNKVVNRFVNVYRTYGEYKGKIFEIDRDITSVKRTVNTELIKTTIIPYSTEQPVDPEDPENNDTFRLGIEDVEWSKANGDPVDKPLGQNYLVDPVALENWAKRNPDGSLRHRKISMEFDTDNPETIINMAWVQLGRYTQPRTNYEVNAIDLYALTNNEDLKHEQILLGDTGGVKDHYFSRPIEIQTRLVEVKRDLFDPRNNDYVFGSSRGIFSANAGVEKAEEVARSIEDVVKRLTDFQQVIDSANRVFRGSNTPSEPMENDIWFRPHPSKQGHSQMLVYNGATWVIEADSSDLEDASRLQFGTIDGGQINVINLVADNITGGQLRLETGLEITNQGSPILTVNSAGEVEFSVSKLVIRNRDIEEELDRIAEFEDGKSAYELAVDNGYTGTEAEWLESLKGSDGEQGVAGERGEDGRTAYFHTAWANNATGTSGFSRTNSTNKLYIGTYSDFEQDSSTDPSKYSWTLVKGEKGDQGEQGDQGVKGDKGDKGEDGVSVVDVDVMYYLSTSQTSLTGGNWLSNPPNWENGKFMWTKTVTTYSTGQQTETDPVNVTGSKGDTGQTGQTGQSGSDGRSVSVLTEQYYLSDSHEELTGGSWSEEAPEWEENKYMWTRIKITYENPSGTDYTTEIVDKSWDAISIANTKADQTTVDEINDKVGDIDSQMPSREEMNYINNALEDYQRDIDNANTELSTVKDDVENLESATNTIHNNLLDTTEKWSFIDRYMIAGNDGLLISDMESGTGIRITDDRIDFLDGAGEPVAYINNQQMQINRGIFVQSATVGEHREETIGDGHTITQWVG